MAEFFEARNLLDKAAPLVFSEAQLETRVAALDQAQEIASRDTDVLSSLSQVETLLTSPQGVNSLELGAAPAQLVRLSVPTDPRYGDLINQISARLSATLQEAVAARKLDTAIAVRDRLRALKSAPGSALQLKHGRVGYGALVFPQGKHRRPRPHVSQGPRQGPRQGQFAKRLSAGRH